MNETDGNGGDLGGGAVETTTTSILAGAAGAEAATPEAKPEGTEGTEGANKYNFIPEKYQVKDHAGSIDLEQTLEKIVGGYTNLEKRLGTGDIPPKEAKDYAVDFGEGALLSFDDFKAEPENQEFLSKAHELGMTDKQVQFVLGEYVQRLPELVQAGKELNVEQAQEALGQVWKTETEFNSNLRHAYNAFQKYASPEDLQSIDEIGNSPLVIKILANIGKTLQEDEGVSKPMGMQQNDVRGLMSSEAYRNPSHPDHKATHQKVARYYNDTYGNQIVGG